MFDASENFEPSVDFFSHTPWRAERLLQKPPLSTSVLLPTNRTPSPPASCQTVSVRMGGSSGPPGDGRLNRSHSGWRDDGLTVEGWEGWLRSLQSSASCDGGVVLHGSSGRQPDGRLAQQERPAWTSGMSEVVERAKGAQRRGFCLLLWLPVWMT